MITIVNIGQRKFTIIGEQGPCALAPLQEMKVKRAYADELIASFPKEIKFAHEPVSHVAAVVQEEKPEQEAAHEVKPEIVEEKKKGKGKK